MERKGIEIHLFSGKLWKMSKCCAWCVCMKFVLAEATIIIWKQNLKSSASKPFRFHYIQNWSNLDNRWYFGNYLQHQFDVRFRRSQLSVHCRPYPSLNTRSLQSVLYCLPHRQELLAGRTCLVNTSVPDASSTVNESTAPVVVIAELGTSTTPYAVSSAVIFKMTLLLFLTIGSL